MPQRRSGSPTSLWNAASVGVSGVSNAVEVMRNTDQMAIWVTTSAATTISLEVAQQSAVNADGTSQDANAANWGLLYYLNTPCQITFASGGTAAMIIPDFEPGWIRLRSSAAATITAGHEVTAG